MDLLDWIDFDARERVAKLLNALGAPGPSGTIAEEKKSHNHMVMPFGECAPFTLKRDFGQVVSLASEVKGDKVTTIMGPTTIDGLTFLSGEALTTPAVTLMAGTTVFRGCTFIKQAGHEDVSCVTVLSAASAIFVGCMFVRQDGSTANAIANAGAAANVKVVGCLRSGFSSFGTTDPPVGSLP